MFYQSENSLHTDLCKIERGTDFSFPLHLHGSFEWIAVTEGEMTVTVDKKPYSLSAGQAVLVFPNQVHALETPRHSGHILCIFSPQLVRAYSEVFTGSLPCDNRFSPSPLCLSALQGLYGSAFNRLQAKGVLYLLCGEFDRTAVYRPRQVERAQLFERIFRFVETHYHGECTMAALSQELSYHYVYLSYRFKQYTGLSFTDYVNRYRVNEACYLLKNSDHTVLRIALDCGFGSLRSFNRNFKAVTGKTPGAYRSET